MEAGRGEVVAREERWALPTALATLAAIGLLVASGIVVSSVNGDGEAEILRAAHEHSSDVTLSSILQTGAFVLLVVPLVYLFQAAAARSDKVRRQLFGLVVAAPLFFAVASVLNAVATDHAAEEFVAGKATTSYAPKQGLADCREEREDDAEGFRDEYGGGAAALKECAATKVADEKASDALADAPTQAAATGFALGGRIGFAFALLYSCLWGMRTGLLSRFWGSLGMALGAAALLLLVQFTLIWFLYFALLVAGWVPGGRPPAWAAGKAVPWPTPGEKAAAELEETPAPGDPAESAAKAEPRKRKQRD